MSLADKWRSTSNGYERKLDEGSISVGYDSETGILTLESISLRGRKERSTVVEYHPVSHGIDVVSEHEHTGKGVEEILSRSRRFATLGLRDRSLSAKTGEALVELRRKASLETSKPKA